jgi:hypothetical protein
MYSGGNYDNVLALHSRVDIHQALISQFSILADFFIMKEPVKD